MLNISIGNIIFQLITLIILLIILILVVIGISSLIKRNRTRAIKDLEIQNTEILKQLSEIKEKMKEE